jgi:multiple sugar transport system permease protein/putative aldouronate transport system permease protein
MTRADRLYETLNTIFLSVVLLIVIYPLIYVVSSSFSSSQALLTGRVWLWPVEPSLDGYRAVFDYRQVWIGYGNSIFYAFFGTIINVALTIMAAYPLSRRDFYGRDLFMLLFLFTMIFNGGLIPTYILVRSLGMINTRWAMLLPNALLIWNVIITRTYYRHNISDELLEAAQLDGCSDIKFMVRIVLPLSGAITAVNVLFYAVFHWNAFFHAFIYLSKKELFPLQLVLREILIANTVDVNMMAFMDVLELEAREGLRELLKYSLIIVASVPVLAMYPFVQKYFVRGVMVGSLKG